jgi:hypothetical protein
LGRGHRRAQEEASLPGDQDGIGTARRQQYTTVGDTTNTAARLVTVAEANMKSQAKEEACTIVPGGPIVNLIGADFSLSPLGDHLVKGKRNPVTCYRLNGENIDPAVPEIDLPSGARRISSSVPERPRTCGRPLTLTPCRCSISR